MDKKEEFKNFVKKNPKLINYVKNGSMNWQKFYEIYDIYGEDNNAWKEYLGVSTAVSSVAGLGDVMNFIKSIDLDSFQNGINSIQRVIGVLEDLTGKGSKKTEVYKPRPMYKHFED